MALRSVMLVLVLAAVVAVPTVPGQSHTSAVDSSVPYIGQLILQSDQDVAERASWGSGTASDPYVISGLVFDSTSGGIAVFVTDTNVHLVLSDFWINGTAPGVGIELAGVTNVTVEHCTFVNADISMGILRNIRIANNSFLGGTVYVGNIFLTDRLWFGTSNITISGNQFSSQGGIDVQNAGNVTVYSNSVYRNSGAGISVSSSKDVLVSDNKVREALWGVSIFTSKSVTVVANDITESTAAGMTGDSVSTNISLHHNNFINNTSPAMWATYQKVQLSIDYPYGGNYWSNASAPDNKSGPDQNISGADGILDEPFNATSDLVDRYPLASPFVRSSAVQPPLARITALPQFGRPNKTFTLDASGSWDARDPAFDMEYRWDWTNDGVWDTPYVKGMTVPYPYLTAQNVTVRVMVRDSDDLSDEATCTLVVDGHAPILNTDFAKGKVVFKTHDPIWLNWSCEDNLSGLADFERFPGWSSHEKFKVLINGHDISDTPGLIKGYFWSQYGNSNSYASNLSIEGLPDGDYVVLIQAIDLAGNVGELEIRFSVHTNILNPSGPLGPWPLIAFIAGIAAVVVAIFYLTFRPRRGSPEASSVPGPIEAVTANR